MKRLVTLLTALLCMLIVLVLLFAEEARRPFAQLFDRGVTIVHDVLDDVVVPPQDEPEPEVITEETPAPLIEDTQKYPYYSMLNDRQKTVYVNALDCINALDKSFMPAAEIRSDEIKEALEAVYYDHPELFWMDTGFSYSYNDQGMCVEVFPEYNSTADDIRYSKGLFNEQADAVIREAELYETDYEKELFVHDRLLELIEYDENCELNQSSYSAMVLHRTVCAGYARAFQYLLQELDITCYYVTGFSEGEEHAWNIVLLDDGFYNVDLTWDDSLPEEHYFFNQNEYAFSKTHEREGNSLRLPACEGTEFIWQFSH